MKHIKAVVEMAENNLSAYLDGVDGVIAVGHNIEELKDSMEKSISLYFETCKEYNLDIPEAFADEYEIVYKYDLCSFLQAYSKILSKSGLQQLTGINQKQLWHYASGKSKPKQATVDKVASSIHSFGRELERMEFA